MKEMAVVPLDSSEIPRTEKTHAALPWSGIQSLMLALLDDAIHSLSSSQRLVRAEAEHWITSQERRYVFSFVVICEMLELEPSAVRRSVMDLVGKKRALGRSLGRSRPNVRHSGPIQLARGRRPQ
jgi:hypothetical protein